MRILLLTGEHPDLPGLTGGIGSFVADASRALAAAGHEVHVLVCAPGMVTTEDHRDGVHVHARGLVPAVRLARGRVARQGATAASCWWHARRLGRFDVIEAPEWQALAAGFSWRRSSPLVVTLQTPSAVVSNHDDTVPAPARLNDRIERWVVRRADVVLSLSELLADELRRLGWLRADDRVDIARPFVRREDWEPSPATTSSGGRAPRLLGVGRIEPRKGFDVLVEAAALLAPEVPGLQVAIAGEAVADHGERLQHLAAKRRVALEQLGRRGRGDLPGILATATAVALPSSFDSFNLAGLEALAAHVPVVVSDRVGLGELADGSEGLQVVERRPDAFAAALKPLLLDPARRERAAEAAGAIAAQLSPAAFAMDRERRYAMAASARLTRRKG